MSSKMAKARGKRLVLPIPVVTIAFGHRLTSVEEVGEMKMAEAMAADPEGEIALVQLGSAPPVAVPKGRLRQVLRWLPGAEAMGTEALASKTICKRPERRPAGHAR